MSTPPIFLRSPRLVRALPKEEIEIPAPPNKPNPARSVTPRIMTAVLMAVIMFSIGITMGRMSMMMFTIPMMLASALGAYATYKYQERQYHQEVQERNSGYQGLLLGYEDQLQNLQREQVEILLERDPTPKECFEWVKDLHRNMWAKTPMDDDFLEVRLGLGKRPSTIKTEPPRPDHPFKPDPLIKSAQELCERFTYVSDAPVSVSLIESRVTGIVGPRSNVLNTVRAFIMQLTIHHAPEEIKVIAIYPEHEREEWAWLRWLPHVWSGNKKQRFMANKQKSAKDLLLAINDMMNKRKNQLEVQGAEQKGKPFSTYFICILADPDFTRDDPATLRLRTEGPGLGFHPIFLREKTRELPQNCQAIVKVTSNESFLALTRPNIISFPFVPDATSINMASHFSQMMARIDIDTVRSDTIPTSISLLNMFGVQRVEELPILDYWKNNEDKASKKLGSLAVPIGVKAGGISLEMDLHEKAHGPNGLVAGMVGAGKSVMLQSLVVSLATYFNPHQLAFVLIDYKGGGMADPFKTLPHTLGTLDNLQKGSLAQRAITSINVESRRRQEMFKAAGVNHINAYQKLYYNEDPVAPIPIPYLVIIVDEFAEMKSERPEDAKEFVKIARLGRALGFCMILAMQKPEGIVDGQIEANTRFRLCLRVAQVGDSRAMLKRPDAAGLEGMGRAYYQVGVNEVFELFQVAYTEAPYDPENIRGDDPHEIFQVHLNGSTRSLYSPNENKTAPEDINQMQVLIKYLEDVAKQNGIKSLDKLWLPPLPLTLSLREKDMHPNSPKFACPQEGWNGHAWDTVDHWLAPVIGLVDDPSKKLQAPLRFDLGKEGHLSIYGAPGSGKTVLLQTMVISLALTYPPEDVNIYIMDFGGRVLKMFEPLPHVGGVVASDEEERIRRLLNFIMKNIQQRKEKFGDVRANSLLAYRQKTKESMPAIVLILDNYVNFSSAYENLQDTILQIVREGNNVGVHLVLTGNSFASIKSKISTNITLAVALNLVEKADYNAIVGRPRSLPEPEPGRGLIRGKPPLEFQTATPAKGENDVERSGALADLIAEIDTTSQVKAPPIPALPDIIHLTDLLPEKTSLPDSTLPESFALPLALEVSELTPFSLDLDMGPNFYITGTAESGKTSLLQTWLLALGQSFSPEHLHVFIFDSQRRQLAPFAQLPYIKKYTTNPDEILGILNVIREEVQKRIAVFHKSPKTRFPKLVIVIDDAFDAFRSTIWGKVKMKVDPKLTEIMAKGLDVDVHFIVASPPPNLSSQGLTRALKDSRTGFQLGTNDLQPMIFNLNLPRDKRKAVLQPGQGYWTRRGRSTEVKLAIFDDVLLDEQIQKIIQQYS